MSEEEPTLGQRLDGQARRIAARSVAVSSWATPFGVLLDHLTERPLPDGGRFTRREVTVAEPAWPAQGHDRPEPPGTPQGRPLPSTVVSRLRTVVGPGVEAMRVHDDIAADETARAHGADAVTIGADVFFRQGQLDPAQPRGFGLLAHEATHVVERSRPGASSRRATAGGAMAEENLALAREAAVVAGPAPAGRPPSPVAEPPPVMAAQFGAPVGAPPTFAAPFSPPVPAALPAAAPAATPAARPMTAAVDRPAGVPAAGGQSIDVDALRGRIMRDLMRQLRDEFERGG